MSEATAARSVCKRCGAVTDWIGNPKVLNGRLPAYEAAVDALERLASATERLDPTEKVLSLNEARAALRRLRDEVPA